MDSEKINRLIAENNLEKALAYIDEWLSNHSKDDKAYYLKGLVFWKQGNWKLTIENYLKAIEINPNSPAKQAYEMVMDIINFSNPDLYNPQSRITKSKQTRPNIPTFANLVKSTKSLVGYYTPEN